MSADISQPVVTVAIVLLLFVSVLGTWVALTSTPEQVLTSGPQQGSVHITIEPLPSSDSTQGQVTINIVKGGQTI